MKLRSIIEMLLMVSIIMFTGSMIGFVLSKELIYQQMAIISFFTMIISYIILEIGK